MLSSKLRRGTIHFHRNAPLTAAAARIGGQAGRVWPAPFAVGGLAGTDTTPYLLFVRRRQCIAPSRVGRRLICPEPICP
jgi:hypothetical protein